MKKYYLHNGTENIGPFNTDELKAKGIAKETQVWYEGLQEWTTAGAIDELKSIMIVVPPPIVKIPELNTIPVVAKKKSRLFPQFLKLVGILILAFFAIAIVADYIQEKNSSSTYEESVMTIAQMEAAEPSSYLTADGTYRPNFLGNKLKITGLIQNKATVTTYKDVVIDVIYYSKTNTEISREKYTVYDFFGPNNQKEFKLKVNNYSNVGSIGWEVVNAVIR